MNYYPRYMGDYQSDTMHLSMTEDGAYTRLLDHYYGKGKPLPGDIKQLCRIARALDKIEQDAVATVAAEFFPLASDGLRHNARADAEIAKWEVIAENNRENGKLGGRPRKKPIINPTGSQPETTPVTDVKPNNNPSGNHSGSKNGGFGNPELTRGKPSPAPTPTPDPDPSPDVHSERANEWESVASQNPGELPAEEAPAAQRNGQVPAPPYVDSAPYEQSIMADFPKGPNPPNWTVAIHNAHQLVSNGIATWPDLVAAVRRYAGYIASGTASMNVAAHNFFDRRKGNYWQQDWKPAATKAEVREDEIVDGALRFLARGKST